MHIVYQQYYFVKCPSPGQVDRYEDMFQFQDGIIDKSDGEEVKEFFQYFIIKEKYYRCKKQNEIYILLLEPQLNLWS